MWDDVVALYERAIEEYGTVDVVVSCLLLGVLTSSPDPSQVANAGIVETGQFHSMPLFF